MKIWESRNHTGDTEEEKYILLEEEEMGTILLGKQKGIEKLMRLRYSTLSQENGITKKNFLKDWSGDVVKKHNDLGRFKEILQQIREIPQEADTQTIFRNEYTKLLDTKENKYDVWNNFIVKYYSQALTDWTRITINKIKFRKTFGQEFAKIEIRLSDLQNELMTREHILIELLGYKQEVERINVIVNEKITIENKKAWDFVKGTVYGAIVGALMGGIVSMILHLLGWV